MDCSAILKFEEKSSADDTSLNPSLRMRSLNPSLRMRFTANIEVHMLFKHFNLCMLIVLGAHLIHEVLLRGLNF